jgi:hypothetical protein
MPEIGHISHRRERAHPRRTAPRAFRVQSNERQQPPIAYRGGTSHGSKTKDICEAVNAVLDFDPLVYAAGIAIKNMKGDVANNGNGTVRPGSRRKAAIRPAGPTRRTGRCPR